MKERLIAKYSQYKNSACNQHQNNKHELSEVLVVVAALADGTLARSSREVSIERAGSTQSRIKRDKSEEQMAHLQDTIEVGSIQSVMQAIQAGQVEMCNSLLLIENHSSSRIASQPTLQSAEI